MTIVPDGDVAPLLFVIIPVTMLLTTAGWFAAFAVWASGFMVREDDEDDA